MGTLLELVFPDQSTHQAIGLLADILCTSRGPVQLEIDGALLSQEPDPSQVVALLRTRAVVNLDLSQLPRVGQVPNLAVYLLRGQGATTIDVEMNVDLNDVADREKLALGLYEFAANMADKHSVEHYFAGLERAWDEDTRIFTDRRWGPLRL